MSKEGDEILALFRKFMFDEVYMSKALIRQGTRLNGENGFYTYYTEKRPDGSYHETRLPETGSPGRRKYPLASRWTGISGLTDNFAINLFEDIFVPRYWTFKKKSEAAPPAIG